MVDVLKRRVKPPRGIRSVSDTVSQNTKKTMKQTFNFVLSFSNLGVVVSIMDNIALIYGLFNSFMGEMIEIKTKLSTSLNNQKKLKPLYGMVLNLGRSFTNVVIFGNATSGFQGSEVTRTKQLMSIPITRAGLMGRVIDSLGNPIDNSLHKDNAKFEFFKRLPIDTKAIGIIARSAINEPLQTGLVIVDATTPIGQGQRELIIGDRKTGKTTVGIDTILCQKHNLISCIYVAVGQKRSAIAKIVHFLKQKGLFFKTVVVSATSAEPAALQFLAPYTGCTIGEAIAKRGGRALIIYDDLSKQAVAYRQLCLILRRSPGREAFPGDVFYLHARLLERAAKLSERYDHGSFTALPIAETQVGDIAAFVPTNLISITDGQIFLEAELFNQGVRPAMNVGLSVSRVGSKAQVTAIKELAGKLKLQLAEYREVQSFSAFASELDEATQLTIQHGSKLVELLKQPSGQPLKVEHEVCLLFAGLSGYLETVEVSKVGKFKANLLTQLSQNNLLMNFNINKKINSSVFNKAYSFMFLNK
jgi:F-type H+-transporting ATPase subunit alpha